MECRSVQVERPSCSTSAGQSGGGASAAGAAAAVDERAREEVDGEVSDVDFLVIAAQEAKEVQDRQLGSIILAFSWPWQGKIHSRFAIFA